MEKRPATETTILEILLVLAIAIVVLAEVHHCRFLKLILAY